MTEAQVVRQLLKPALWLAGLAPISWLVWTGFHGGLSADPVKYLTHFTGRTTLIIVLLTLSVTPIRNLSGRQGLGRVRRLVGLFAFFYAVVHLLIYFVFDRGLVLAELGEDIAKRPYITIGFTAWTMLLVLATTSPLAMVRRLGGKRWQQLHRLIYLVVPLGLLHFAWAQKKDLSPLWPYLVAAGGLLALRLVAWQRSRRPRVRASRVPPEG